MKELLENYTPSGDLLNIHTYPDPILTKIASEVTADEFNSELQATCMNMLNTMYNAPGIGLAAPQIGLSKRIFVIDTDYTRDEDEDTDEVILSNFNPKIFINPKIITKEGETTYQEGCLSLPGIYEDVLRSDVITLEYQDLNGHKHTIKADGLFAICIQHENDHLNGVVFIDHLSNLKKTFFKKKLSKEKQKKSQHL